MKILAALLFVFVATAIVGCPPSTPPNGPPQNSCANPEGTNAAMAELATAISQELHRWQIATDLYAYNDQGQRRLGLTPAGLAACGGECPITADILTFQDPRMDQKIVFGDVKLSSPAFASRLTAGYGLQVSCAQNGQCSFPQHALGSIASQTPSACGFLYKIPATKPADQGSVALTVEEASQLKNALVWTASNGPNPYIDFQADAGSVTIDPTGIVGPNTPQTASTICQKTSLTDINNTPCICAANNIYSNGQLRNDDPLTTRTYYCRQM